MRTSMAGIVIALALVAAGCGDSEPAPKPAAPAPAAPAAPVTPPPAPATQAAKRAAKPRPEFKVPDVDGFKRGETRQYDTPTASGDRHVGNMTSFSTANRLLITVYDYSSGNTAISDGVSQLARDEAGRAKAEVLEAEKQGFWKSVKVVSEGDATLGNDPEAGRAAAIILTLGAPKENLSLKSEIYVTGRANHFVKLRITYPADAPICEEEKSRFLTAVGLAVVR